MQVERVTLIIAEGGVFRLYEGKERGGTGEAPFEGIALLISILGVEKRPLSRAMVERREADEADREVLNSFFDHLGAVLVIPLPAREGLAGLIALGQKKSGELFIDEDLELLTTMANQAATAIENARSY